MSPTFARILSLGFAGVGIWLGGRLTRPTETVVVGGGSRIGSAGTSPTSTTVHATTGARHATR